MENLTTTQMIRLSEMVTKFIEAEETKTDWLLAKRAEVKLAENKACENALLMPTQTENDLVRRAVNFENLSGYYADTALTN